MARRKGKSRRRIKDWYSRFVGGDDEDRSARREKLSKRAVKLPPSRTDQRADRDATGIEGMPQAQAMVAGFYPGGALVRVGPDQLLCGIAKTFRAAEGSSALAVGDDVTIALTRGGHADAAGDDPDRADGMILSRQPRRTALARPRPQSKKRTDVYDNEPFDKIIAANMDVLLIVVSSREPPLSHALIDRFLIVADRSELEPVLVINKIDLGRPDEGALADFEALGVKIVFCSAITAEGIESLPAVLSGKRSVLAGASGVGKSTLINAIIPHADAVTRTVRAKTQKGRHTTSAAVVYDLPYGGLIIDTPGIRELGMKIDPEDLPWYFPEFEPLAPKCQFHDCTHTHEPNCAVIEAVAAGVIPRRRYESYLRLLNSLNET